MERLTKVSAVGEHLPRKPLNLIHKSDSSESNLTEILEKLGEYEDAEEQGLLLRLPCKVGDKVYQISENFIEPCTVETIFLGNYRDRNGNWCNMAEIHYDRDDCPYVSTEMYFTDIGETVFLTETEAEAKLKEMEEDITNFNPSSSNPYSFVSTSKPEVEDRIRKENKKGEQEMITMEECPYQLHCGWCTKFDCPCSELTEKGESDGE